jgi:glycosyltransferase involved in cell wall biosynthesis
VTNKEKFCDKWKEELQDHSAPYKIPLCNAATSGHKVRPIVLFIDSQIINPTKDSGSLRSFEILLLTQELGYEVAFLTENDNPFGISAELLRQNGVTVLNGRDEAKQFFEEAGDFVKLIFLARARTAHSWHHFIKELRPEIPIAFDTVDIHHLRELREAELEGSDFKHLLALSTRRIEMYMAENSDATVVVSHQEVDYLKSFIPQSQIHVVGNIHRIEEGINPFSNRKGLLFVGSFAHTPNVDGLEWFFSEVWKYIDPSIQTDGLQIIGANPPKKLVKSAPNSVSFLGWVNSTNQYVDSARISIAPLRYGAGVKGKVGEAWSRGLPAIGTTIAFEGMIEPGAADFPSADDPKKFAELINSVYSSESSWIKASEAGQRRVQETLSRDVAKKALVHLIDSVAR